MENSFDAVRAMMLENVERVGFVTQIYVDLAVRIMRLFPGANEELIRTSRNTFDRKVQTNERLWRGFCMPRIFRRPSAFRSSTFSLS